MARALIEGEFYDRDGAPSPPAQAMAQASAEEAALPVL